MDRRLPALAAGLLTAALLTGGLAACSGGTPAPTCTDGARNGTETGTDCGGPTCTPCPAGQACQGPADCLSAVCGLAGTCAAAACDDRVRNGAETGLDCGGPTCTPCADGQACKVDGDCASGRCLGQVCLRALGAACDDAAQCASGACADGLCCETSCTGLCEACNLPGRFGHCDPVPAGADPADECQADAVSGCGQDGTCSGGRSCRLWQAGTACSPGACTTATRLQPAAACDGQGACIGPAAQDCSPLACDPDAAACRIRCSATQECAAGFGCSPEGVCLELDGRPCGGDGECLSGFCTDGVCCAARCDGTCEACDQAGRVGLCDPVPAGADPADECAATPAAGCGTTGACSGTRSCAVWAGGTPCAPASCVSSTVSHLASLCDGAGTCSDTGTLDCAPNVCGAGGVCLTTCSGNPDCAPGYACAGGTCRRVLGSPCTGGGECVSGFCADGYCCSTACAGTCEACDQPGRAGTCDPVPGGSDPAGECADQGSASCGTSGVCSGARSCALYSAGTVCAAASCSGGTTATLASTCSGAGACLGGGQLDCSPLTCNPASGACRSSCATSADCAPGFACAAGACRRAQGAACATDGECASGFCTDGACCNARCTGTCQACNFPGTVGTCTFVASGQDPASECPADGCHTGCNGSGACGVKTDGTSCGAGLRCSAGSCLDMDECTQGIFPCDANATCTNTVGSFTCACNAGWLGDGVTCRRPVSCAELHAASPGSPSGLHAIDPDGAGGLPEFTVSCDMVTDGGGWTVFQRRQDATDFFRTFAEYQAGFGSPAGSHWLGLDRLVALTAAARTLRVELASVVPSTVFETYTTFSVGAAPDYVLTVAGPAGTAGDSLTYQAGMSFSARDRDADTIAGSCADLFQAGWWFRDCHLSNLNGPYVPGPVPSGVTVVWSSFRTLREGLTFTEMKLR